MQDRMDTSLGANDLLENAHAFSRLTSLSVGYLRPGSRLPAESRRHEVWRFADDRHVEFGFASDRALSST
jgi:hypothetical protein